MENSKSANKGTFLWRLSKKFQFAADKLIPDSFVFCLILTFIVFVLGIIFRWLYTGIMDCGLK